MATGNLASVATPPSLKRNVSWYFAGHLVHSLAQWGTFAGLAKLGSVEHVGVLALALATTTPLFTFLNLQLRGIVATDAANKYGFSLVWSVRCATSVVALLVGLAFSWLFGSTNEATITIALIALGKSIESLSDVIHGRIQREERLDWIARTMALRGGISFLLFMGAYVLSSSIAFAAAAQSFAAAAVLLALDIPALRKISPRDEANGSTQISLKLAMPSISSLISLLRSAVPLGSVLLLYSFAQNMPRYALEKYVGLAELGIFAALAHFISAAAVLVSSLTNAAGPRLAKCIHMGDIRKFFLILHRLYAVIGCLLLAGMVVVVLAGRPMVRLLMGAEVAKHSALLVPLAIGGCLLFATSVAGVGLTAAGVHRQQLPLALLAAILSAISSAYLIPRFGLSGAPVVLIVTYGACLIASHAVLLLKVRGSLRRIVEI